MPNTPLTSLALCSAATSASWHPKHISDAVRAAPGQATHAFGGAMGVGAGTTGLVVVVLAAAAVIVGGG